jgi:hypothetical protein
MNRLIWVLLSSATAIASPLPRNWNSAVNLQVTTQGKDQIDPSCEDEKNYSRCFKMLRMANGTTPDHFLYSENTVQGPDGEKIYFQTIHYESHQRASEEFQNRLKSATKVIEHLKSPGDEGQDDEFAILDVGGDKQPSRTIVITVVGKEFRNLKSDSSQDVLIIANQMKHHVKTQ